jgi:hypothetical protein
MTEQDVRGEQLHAAAASQADGVVPPAVSSMTAWGRRAALIYLGVGTLALVGMAVETVLGHAGTASMFAAFLAVPWSMLVAGFAPPLPANLPMALGLALRMAPLALFMLLNAAIVAGIAARSERDLTGRGAKALLLVLLAGALSSSCALSSQQRVLVAAPTSTLVFFNGGRETTILGFDLSAVPEWRDHRASLRDVTELSLMGSFTNPTDSLVVAPAPVDVEIWVGANLSSLPGSGTSTDIWGPLHLVPGETHRVDWDEGVKRFNANKDVLGREMMGDGQFSLMFVSSKPPGSFGGATVDNFRLGATLQVR